LLRNNTVLDNRVMTTLYADIELISDLKFRSEIAVDYGNALIKAFQPSYEWGTIVNRTSQLGQSSNQNFFWVWRNYVTYNRSFNDHGLTAMVGYEAQKGQYDNFTAYKLGMPNDLPSMRQGDISNIANTGVKGWNSLISSFARAIYNYDDRYLVTATIRRDGSSRFGPENRWGWFPSASVGWRISQESFMGQNNFVNELKLRAGWGLVGNEAINNYAFGSALTPVNTYFGSGVRNSAYSNPLVQWESTAQYNIGLDVALLNTRIDLSVDAYLKETDNLLLELPLPGIFGDQINGPQANVGRMTNKGIEVSLNTVNVETDRFKWTTNANFALNRNE